MDLISLTETETETETVITNNTSSRRNRTTIINNYKKKIKNAEGISNECLKMFSLRIELVYGVGVVKLIQEGVHFLRFERKICPRQILRYAPVSKDQGT